MKLGFITSNNSVLLIYFPTAAEPELFQKEPLFTPDDQLLVDYLREYKKIDVQPVIWGTDVNELKDFDALIIRSTWDYMDSSDTRNDFLQWLTLLGQHNIRVFNNIDIVKWLLDKHYLKDFNSADVKTVPTKYIEKDESCSLLDVYKEKGPFVVKPCISAAGKGLKFIENEMTTVEYQKIIDCELENRSLMIQEYIPEIKSKGEWSLIFYGNEYGHSVHKTAARDSILVQAEKGGKLLFEEPKKNIINFAHSVVDNFESAYKIGVNKKYNNILYLRIDIIESQYGPLLSEVEGVEPELFFRANQASVKLFTDKLLELL